MAGMKNLKFTNGLGALLLLLVVVPAAWAAEIKGKATDRSGAVLSSARVSLPNVASGAQETAETDAGGKYSFSSITVGIYRVSIEYTGFSQDARNVSVSEDSESLDVNFIISPGGLSASVTVTASRSARDTLEVPVRAESLGQETLDIKNHTR